MTRVPGVPGKRSTTSPQVRHRIRVGGTEIVFHPTLTPPLTCDVPAFQVEPLRVCVGGTRTPPEEANDDHTRTQTTL
jgi:hypothetical protein